MPFQIQPGKQLNLVNTFIDIAFTEGAMAQRVQIPYGLRRVALADGQQANIPGTASGRPAGPVQPLPDGRQPLTGVKRIDLIRRHVAILSGGRGWEKGRGGCGLQWKDTKRAPPRLSA